MDALVATVETDLDDLPSLLARYLERFQATDYKTHFAWVDHVAEVRDRSLLAALDNRLVGVLSSWSPTTSDKVWLVAPDVIDWHDVGSFTYTRSYSDPKTDLHIRDFLATVPSGSTL